MLPPNSLAAAAAADSCWLASISTTYIYCGDLVNLVFLDLLPKPPVVTELNVFYRSLKSVNYISLLLASFYEGALSGISYY